MKEKGDVTTLYLHVFQWPGNGGLKIPGLKAETLSASLLADGRKLKVWADDHGTHIRLWNPAPDPIDSVIALQVSGPYEITEK